LGPSAGVKSLGYENIFLPQLGVYLRFLGCPSRDLDIILTLTCFLY